MRSAFSNGLAQTAPVLSLIGTIAVIGVFLALVNFGTLHFLGLDNTLNDQVIYIDAARHLSFEGRLTTGAFYPATLLQDYCRNYLYMPGHAFALFLSFTIFSETQFTAILPNLFGYMICLLCLYVLGRKLIGGRSRFFAPLAFMLFPAFLVYATSAMAEITFLATGALALTAFTQLPVRWRHFAVPFLLVGPFLFRETGAVWIIPMVVLILMDTGPTKRQKFVRMMIALLGAVACLTIIYKLEWISDRPSLFLQNLLGRTFEEKYTDAYALDGINHGIEAIFSATLARFFDNIRSLFRLLAKPSFESISLNLLLWLPFIACFKAWKNLRLRPIAISWIASTGSFILLISALYRWDTFIGLRHMLTPSILGLLLVCGAVADLKITGRRWIRCISSSMLLIGSMILYLDAAGKVTEWDRAQSMAQRVIRTAEPPVEGALIADLSIGPIYLYDNPMAVWSLPPANDRTLIIAMQKLNVSGMLLFQGNPFWTRIGDKTLQRIGMQHRGTFNGLVLMERI